MFFKKKQKASAVDDTVVEATSGMTEESGVDESQDETTGDAVSESDKANVVLPLQLQIGYYANISKKELKAYLHNMASGAGGLGSSALGSCYYDIRKFRGGFIWELQEGGNGQGCLGSIIKLLEAGKDEIIISIEERQVKVVKRKNNAGVVSFLVNEDEQFEQTDGIEFNHKMTPVLSSGYAFMVFSMILLGFAVSSLLLSVVFKYVVLNQEAHVELKSSDMPMPHTRISELKMLPLDTKYVPEIRYAGGSWKPTRVMDEAPAEDKSQPVAQSQPKLQNTNNKQATQVNPPGVLPGMNPTTTELHQLLEDDQP